MHRNSFSVPLYALTTLVSAQHFNLNRHMSQSIVNSKCKLTLILKIFNKVSVQFLSIDKSGSLTIAIFVGEIKTISSFLVKNGII